MTFDSWEALAKHTGLQWLDKAGGSTRLCNCLAHYAERKNINLTRALAARMYKEGMFHPKMIKLRNYGMKCYCELGTILGQWPSEPVPTCRKCSAICQSCLNNLTTA